MKRSDIEADMFMSVSQKTAKSGLPALAQSDKAKIG
jgi:hypothetical protein